MYRGSSIFIKTKNAAPHSCKLRRVVATAPEMSGSWEQPLGRLEACVGMCDNDHRGPFHTWDCVTLWIHPGNLKVHPRLAFDPIR